MKCLDQLTASIFADGEAPATEARALTAHIAECSRCRELVAAVRQENQLLTNVLRELEAEGVAGEEHGFSPGRALVIVLAGMLVARLAFQSFSFNTPAELEWIKSAGGGSWWQVLFSVGFYLRENGTEIIKMITTMAVLAILVLLLVSGALLRRPRGFAGLVLFVLVAGMLTAPASALEHRKGQTVVVRSNETIHDTLIATGETVDVDGNIEGDLILMCRQGTVRGKVEGNIIVFARTLQIEGQVGGSAFTFGQWVSMRGETVRNLFAFAQNLSLSSDSRVGANLTSFASEIDLQGAVTQDVNTFSDSATVRGNVGRNLSAHARLVTLAAPARIGGNLVVHVPAADRLQVGQDVTIAGSTDVHLEKHRSRYATGRFYFWQTVQLAGAWIIGMLLMWLLPGILPGGMDGGTAMARRMGIGFLLLIAIPVACVVAAVTLIGIPLALIVLVLWLVGIYLAKILVAVMVGRTLLAPGQPGLSGFALALFVGMLLVFIAINLPFVGGLVRLGIVVLGLGMAYEWVRGNWRRHNAPAVAQP